MHGCMIDEIRVAKNSGYCLFKRKGFLYTETVKMNFCINGKVFNVRILNAFR